MDTTVTNTERLKGFVFEPLNKCNKEFLSGRFLASLGIMGACLHFSIHGDNDYKGVWP